MIVTTDVLDADCSTGSMKTSLINATKSYEAEPHTSMDRKFSMKKYSPAIVAMLSIDQSGSLDRV